MNYYVTQEQYERLRDFRHNLETIIDREDFEILLNDIGNQKASDLV
jgi:hypothetical protein